MYRWMDESNSAKSVEVDPMLEISQYDLEQVTIETHTTVPRGNSGQGIMNALSMMTMGFGGKSQMPHVPYATALDWFIILCFSFVFGVMIEFALINFKDKITTDLKRILQDKIGKKKQAKDLRKSAEKPKTLSVPSERQRSLSMVEFPSVVVIPDSSSSEISGTKDDAQIFIDDVTEGSRHTRHVYGKINKKGSETSSSGKEQEAQVISPIIKIIRRLSSVMLPNDDTPPPVTPRKLPSITVTRSFSESNLVNLSLDGTEENVQEGVYEDITTMNVIDMGEENNYSIADDNVYASAAPLSFVKRVLRPVVYFCYCCWMKPVKIWRDFQFLPGEEEVSQQMMSTEQKEKFTRIDIEARKAFPASFFTLLTIYWVLYIYYITDEFPSTKKLTNFKKD